MKNPLSKIRQVPQYRKQVIPDKTKYVRKQPNSHGHSSWDEENTQRNCVGCGIHYADYPSDVCIGCHAYQGHAG